ncbi:hypothetical protein [Nostoc sp. NZL]|uniref:hypothetical protein n=1 Tax=Nostoc sp. NZL TaxID=2650612 RepID=UPI0018C55F34|nr:hypothetical protein [Nostoc sp. NZL]
MRCLRRATPTHSYVKVCHDSINTNLKTILSGRLRFFTSDEHLVVLLAEATQQLQQGKQ